MSKDFPHKLASVVLKDTGVPSNKRVSSHSKSILRPTMSQDCELVKRNLLQLYSIL